MMPLKILVVDDEPNLEPLIRQIFRQQVRDQVYEFIFAVDGLDALAQLAADPEIEIVITDINMPRMDGLALLTQIAETKATFNHVLTPLILSAYDDMSNIRRAMNSGAFDFLTKPIDIQDLRITVDKTVQHVQRLKRAIEQEHQAQAALRRMNEELEQRVKQRTAELEAMNSLLQTNNAELDAFAHTVAHDLKNPLAMVTLLADYLIQSRLEVNPEEHDRALEILKAAGYKAANIIDELLLLAGVRKDRVELHWLDMDQIVSQARERLAPLIQELAGEIHLPVAWPMAWGYGPWIEEVWINYLSNGLKYGGQPPCLRLGAETQPDGMVRFWVHDNGAGLSPANQAVLFTEFTRLTTTRIDGHGLGLSIVRRIIKKLGGQVGVESQDGPDQGCLFYFTLPAAPDSATPYSTEHSYHPSITSPLP